MTLEVKSTSGLPKAIPVKKFMASQQQYVETTVRNWEATAVKTAEPFMKTILDSIEKGWSAVRFSNQKQKANADTQQRIRTTMHESGYAVKFDRNIDGVAFGCYWRPLTGMSAWQVRRYEWNWPTGLETMNFFVRWFLRIFATIGVIAVLVAILWFTTPAPG